MHQNSLMFTGHRARKGKHGNQKSERGKCKTPKTTKENSFDGAARKGGLRTRRASQLSIGSLFTQAPPISFSWVRLNFLLGMYVAGNFYWVHLNPTMERCMSKKKKPNGTLDPPLVGLNHGMSEIRRFFPRAPRRRPWSMAASVLVVLKNSQGVICNILFGILSGKFPGHLSYPGICSRFRICMHLYSVWLI